MLILLYSLWIDNNIINNIFFSSKSWLTWLFMYNYKSKYSKSTVKLVCNVWLFYKYYVIYKLYT